MVLIIIVTIKMFYSKKTWIKIIASTLTLGLLILSFSIYKAFYPSEEFYIQEWKYSTDLPFPESGEIVWKDATYPDIHGDYSASAIVELSSQDFIKLRNSIKISKVLKPDSKSIGYKGILEQFLTLDQRENLNFKDFYFSTIKAYFKIGFDEENNTIIFQRHSS